MTVMPGVSYRGAAAVKESHGGPRDRRARAVAVPRTRVRPVGLPGCCPDGSAPPAALQAGARGRDALR
jgi:hypothetical protein